MSDAPALATGEAAFEPFHALPADGTTAALLDAAAAVFAEKGYEGAGVAEIARRAGMTTGAIYSRFSGKAELLAAAIRACSGDEFDELFAQHAFDQDPRDLLTTVGTHLVTRRPDAMAPLLLEAFVAARRDPALAAQLLEQFDARRERLLALLRAGQDAGVVDPDLDAYAIAHFAHAVGLGFLLYGALGVEGPDAAAWHDVVARVVAAFDPTSRNRTEP